MMGSSNETLGDRPPIKILSLGAGVQSTAVYLMCIEELDYAVFADTQDEPKDVYPHLEWLISLNGPKILVGSKGKLSAHLKLGTNSTGGRFASIPAFTGTNEKDAGKVKRQCTKEYKTEIVDRIIRRSILGLKPRHRVKKGRAVHLYFGISADEAGRSAKIIKRLSPHMWIKPVFPLLMLGMTRADCERWLEGRVPHKVPRSACTFCPYHSDREWLRMQTEKPEEFAEAVEVDEALRKPGNVVNRKIDQPMYLHRSCQPLSQVNFAARIEARLRVLIGCRP